MFNELHNAFEKSNSDLFKLQQKDGFSKYLLVRSLGNVHLQELIAEVSGKKTSNTKADVLYQELFESAVTEARLVEYIRSKYPSVREERKEQEMYLPGIIEGFGSVKCGVRNDNLNDVAKDLVRDKTIKTKEDLERKVDELLSGTVRGYILWQYYNQVTNDLIEHIFNDNEFVVPTLRKIKYVDFMVLVDGKIIPFDLKITHISDKYFDLYSKGLDLAPVGSPDDYLVTAKDSEIDAIKSYYKERKSDLGLPNVSGLEKVEIIELLEGQKDDAPTVSFVDELKRRRKDMVNNISKDLRSLEWWNYKYQGERLFKNNNRFFIFLTYESSFEDARPLKGNLEIIAKKVSSHLAALKDGKFNTVNYNYTKDREHAGQYKVFSTSVLVTG